MVYFESVWVVKCKGGPTLPTNNKGIGTVVVAVIVTLAVAGTGGYMFGARSQRPEAQVVASVNSENITKDQLYDRMVKQYGLDTVNSMINEKLVNQAAAKAGITVTDAEVNASIQKIKDQIGGDDQLNQALAQYGMTLDQLKQQQAVKLKLNKILGKDIKPDDATLQKYFQDNLAQFDTYEVRSRHILVKTEEEAKAIKAQLDAGADFATLAKEKSTDPTAKDNGGDLGFNKRGVMDAEYDKVVFALKKGEISQPFQTQFGWHVAQVTDTKGSTPTFDQVKDKVREAYIEDQVSQKTQQWLNDQKAAAKITNTLDTTKK